MPHIFLESHNINNLYFGLGQYNKQLIEALHIEILKQNDDLEFTVMSSRKSSFSKKILNDFKHKSYKSIYRKKWFRIRKK